MSALLIATTVGSAATGGVFLGFSTFVMHGLDRLPPATATAAMQSINTSAVRPGFMTVLFGTAVGCGALAVHAALHPEQRSSGLVVAGSALYLFGAVGLTATRHVPFNNILAARPSAMASDCGAWAAWSTRWRRWNHVRTASALAAASAFAAAGSMT
ncbi:DUF1772 domain-containing protein [Jannaschia sp. R86511]|uniref:anthrone oxygenase family protein n=1 Tax=Jannaschia sp. R86511 TaxID=3093853 RepID=UPI0036D30650